MYDWNKSGGNAIAILLNNFLIHTLRGYFFQISPGIIPLYTCFYAFMATILHIETSTTVCSVALSKDGEITGVQESVQPNVHAEKLAVFIDTLMKEAVLSYSALDAVAIGTGPGSYTGLRIGTSTAKGLCYALDKPLLAIPTLKAMALASAITVQRKDIYYCSMIDARRLEVYTGLYDYAGKEIMPVEAKILDTLSFAELLNKKTIAFSGDGMPKMKALLAKDSANCIWMDDVYASAKNMALLSEEYYAKKEFSNVAYYEPFYLKDFVAGKKMK